MTNVVTRYTPALHPEGGEAGMNVAPKYGEYVRYNDYALLSLKLALTINSYEGEVARCHEEIDKISGKYINLLGSQSNEKG